MFSRGYTCNIPVFGFVWKWGVYPKKVNLQQELNDDEPVDSADTILRTEHDTICHTQLVYIDHIP